MPDLSLIHRFAAAREGTAPHPALILLHGLGSDEAELFSLTTYLDARLVVISARAPFSYRWGGYAWYDLEGHGPGLGSESIEHSLQLLLRFLHEVIDEYALDPKHLYLGGFSMGAAMTGAMALLHPDQIAAAIMVSGYLPPDPENRYGHANAQGLPIFQANGTQDPLIRLEYARATRDRLLEAGVDLTYREYPIGHSVDMQELMDMSAWLDGVMGKAVNSED